MDSNLMILLVGVVLNFFGQVIVALFAYKAKVASAATKHEFVETAKAVSSIEKHTNSERTETLKLMEELRRELNLANKENAILQEAARGRAVAAEVAKAGEEARKAS